MTDADEPASDPIARTVVVRLPEGLHVRPCSLIAKLAAGIPDRIRLTVGDESADAASMFDLMALGAAPGTEIVVSGDAEVAETIDRIVSLFERDFADDAA